MRSKKKLTNYKSGDYRFTVDQLEDKENYKNLVNEVDEGEEILDKYKQLSEEDIDKDLEEKAGKLCKVLRKHETKLFSRGARDSYFNKDPQKLDKDLKNVAYSKGILVGDMIGAEDPDEAYNIYNDWQKKAGHSSTGLELGLFRLAREVKVDDDLKSYISGNKIIDDLSEYYGDGVDLDIGNKRDMQFYFKCCEEFVKDFEELYMEPYSDKEKKEKSKESTIERLKKGFTDPGHLTPKERAVQTGVVVAGLALGTAYGSIALSDEWEFGGSPFTTAVRRIPLEADITEADLEGSIAGNFTTEDQQVNMSLLDAHGLIDPGTQDVNGTISGGRMPILMDESNETVYIPERELEAFFNGTQEYRGGEEVPIEGNITGNLSATNATLEIDERTGNITFRDQDMEFTLDPEKYGIDIKGGNISSDYFSMEVEDFLANLNASLAENSRIEGHVEEEKDILWDNTLLPFTLGLLGGYAGQKAYDGITDRIDENKDNDKGQGGLEAQARMKQYASKTREDKDTWYK